MGPAPLDLKHAQKAAQSRRVPQFLRASPGSKVPVRSTGRLRLRLSNARHRDLLARRLQRTGGVGSPERMEACGNLVPGGSWELGMESGDIVSAGGLQGALRERRGLIFRIALDRMARWFPKNPRVEGVTTTLGLDLASERVWEALRFYEEVPSRPSAFLRLVLPTPRRSEGQKVQPGALIRCTYEGGSLVKRITVADRAHSLRFEVLEQRLGIENCISLGEGSYEIRKRGTGCVVSLTTAYRGHLRPRFLWRPLERALAHAVHRHILGGLTAPEQG